MDYQRDPYRGPFDEGSGPPDWRTKDNGGPYQRPRTNKTSEPPVGHPQHPKFPKKSGDRPVTRHRLSQAFHDTLKAIGLLHDKKQADYGRTDDPFANVRASEDFGIDGWVGALIRMNDKMRRLQKAAQGGEMLNESVEDSFMDLACYAIIGLVLYQEANNNE